MLAVSFLFVVFVITGMKSPNIVVMWQCSRKSFSLVVFMPKDIGGDGEKSRGYLNFSAKPGHSASD